MSPRNHKVHEDYVKISGVGVDGGGTHYYKTNIIINGSYKPIGLYALGVCVRPPHPKIVTKLHFIFRVCSVYLKNALAQQKIDSSKFRSFPNQHPPPVLCKPLCTIIWSSWRRAVSLLIDYFLITELDSDTVCVWFEFRRQFLIIEIINHRNNSRVGLPLIATQGQMRWGFYFVWREFLEVDQ